MAELLIRVQASSNPEASEVGDIIAICPDGHVWGKSEGLPEYCVIKLPNLKVSDIDYLKSPLISNVDSEISLRIDKGIWENQLHKDKMLTNLSFINTPVSIPQEDNTYLVMGKVSTSKLAKRRKYKIPISLVQEQLDNKESIITIDKKDLLSNILEKTL